VLLVIFITKIFYVFTKRPYSSTGTYGSGELFHFITSYKHTFGSILSFTFIIGAVSILWDLIKKKLVGIENDLKWILLILFPIISVVGVHSILWWKGMQGSAGLLRVLATIVPLASIVGLLAINKGERIFFKSFKSINKQYITGALFLIGGVLVYLTSANLYIDDRMISSEKVLLKTAEWYKENEKGTKVYYMPPYFAYVADLNPFGKDTNMEMFKMFKDKKMPSNNIEMGELILWDGQFSKIEGKIPLEYMQKDPNLIHVKTFLPEKSFKIYGKSYEVHLFKKVKDKQEKEIFTIISRIKKDVEWFEKVKIEAKARSIEVDEMLEISAKYVIKNRGIN